MMRGGAPAWLGALCGLALAPALLAQAPDSASRPAPESAPVEGRYLDRMPIERYALVVGVQRYENLEPVQNAVNDAQVMGRTLANVGFRHVRVLQDPGTREAILDAAAELARLAGKGQPATIVFYFAGHGFQGDGANYLALKRAGRPVRDAATREMNYAPLLDGSIDLASIAAALGSERRAGATIFLIDACRSEVTIDRPEPPGVLERSGFRRDVPVPKTLVSYSTGFGKPAKSQGKTEGNSPYVAGLRHLIPQERMQFDRLLNHLSARVSDDTNTAQVPDSEHREVAGTYFIFQRTDDDREDELARWKKAMAPRRRVCVVDFLADYRDGDLTQQAMLFLEREQLAASVDPGDVCNRD